MTTNILMSCVQRRREPPPAPIQLDKLPELAMEIVIHRLNSCDQDSFAEVSTPGRQMIRSTRREERALRRALAAVPDADAFKRVLASHARVASNLTWLDLTGQGLGTAGAITVSRALREHCPSLERLSLGENQIQSIDARTWELPETLTVLNISGNPNMLAPDAPLWKLPAGLLGLNITGVALPRAWDGQGDWRAQLRLIQGDAVENAVGLNDADAWLRQHVCGPQMGGARRVLTHPLTHALAYCVTTWAVSRAACRQLPPLDDARWGSLAARVFLGDGWQVCNIISLSLPSDYGMVASPARRAALGDVSGRLGTAHDLATEGLFLAGNSLLMASMAPGMAWGRMLPILAVGAPVVGPSIGALLGSMFGMFYLGWFEKSPWTVVAASFAAFGATAAGSTCLMMKCVPDYMQRLRAAAARGYATCDDVHAYVREAMRTSSAWLVGVPPPVVQ